VRILDALPGLRFRNASGIKFCGECGAPLKLNCSSCGFTNAPGIKFCGDCGGQRLGESPKPSAAPDPRAYAPKRLAEHILTSRTALALFIHERDSDASSR